MYHYTESGLNNVWLANGFTVHDTPYGKAVSVKHADALNRMIARHLVGRKPRLSGSEFRFIRKQLDLSQASLARIMGKDVQSIARWEKSGRVPKMAERFLRAIHREMAGGNESIIEMVERLNRQDQAEDETDKLMFNARGGRWMLHAA
ncbi:MAG: helix-turn-helix domain-containing protein [Rhodospirillaceae bacterium]|nr:helix-turn-helix domain-containing protein [Rhodospirillaceae bacterium]